MEKKSSNDNVESRSRGRRDTSERKPDQADSKEQSEGGGEAPVAKNRRRRAGGDENGWMTNNSAGPVSRHASIAAVPMEEDDPKDSQAVR